jgi:adenylate cyclase class IV
MKHELRFLNIDVNVIKKNLHLLDKKIIKNKVLLRWDSFDYKDKFIRVRDEGNGNITLTLKTDLDTSQPTSKTIFVNDYFTTVDILNTIDIKSKYRVEKIRETWELNNNCVINFDMYPGLPYYMEIKSNNKKNLMTLVKKLNLTIDKRKHSEMGADTMYYDMYNIKNNRPIGDLTFKDAGKIFNKYIKKNKDLFEKILLEQINFLTKSKISK